MREREKPLCSNTNYKCAKCSAGVALTPQRVLLPRVQGHARGSTLIPHFLHSLSLFSPLLHLLSPGGTPTPRSWVPRGSDVSPLAPPRCPLGPEDWLSPVHQRRRGRCRLLHPLSVPRGRRSRAWPSALFSAGPRGSSAADTPWWGRCLSSGPGRLLWPELGWEGSTTT